MGEQDDFARVTARLPPRVLRLLKQAADQANRSINAEIITRLRRSLEMEERALRTADRDPLQVILASAEEIASLAARIEKGVLVAGVASGKVRLEDVSPSYGELGELVGDERQLVKLFREMSESRQRNLLELLSAKENSA